MKKIAVFILVGFISGILGAFVGLKFALPQTTQIIQRLVPAERALDKYSIDSLSNTVVKPSKIEIGEILQDKPEFTSYVFSMNFDPTLLGTQNKKLTGVINIPKVGGPFPVILMFRGYVDQKLYVPGEGTMHAGEVFVKNGFITVAPDFLGYGESDSEAGDIFESRFQTYTTAMAVLESVKSLPQFDGDNLFLWGHSNGGHIALALLTITGKAYPTVLWAPVSKPFPYSVLYYTDDSDDGGKLIRRELAKFESLYDTDLYSVNRYYNKIQAQIELYQGNADDAVPNVWSDILTSQLKKAKVDIKYYTYPGANHNLTPGWDDVVGKNLIFFEKYRK